MIAYLAKDCATHPLADVVEDSSVLEETEAQIVLCCRTSEKKPGPFPNEVVSHGGKLWRMVRRTETGLSREETLRRARASESFLHTFTAARLYGFVLRNGPMQSEGLRVVSDEPLREWVGVPFNVEGAPPVVAVFTAVVEGTKPLQEGAFLVYVFDGWQKKWARP